MHRLLLRQLKRAMPDVINPASRGDLPGSLQRLLALVDDAYRHFDDEREILDRALDVSSEELTERNTLMRTVFQALPDVFLWVDAAGLVKDVQGGLQSTLGQAPASVINRPIAALPTIIAAEAWRRAARMLGSAPRCQIEYTLDTSDGPRHLEARFATLLDGMTLVLIRDISDRIRAEDSLRGMQDRLDHIIEFLPDATLVVDREHRVVAWNRAMEDMTGVPKADILGKGDHAYGVPFYGEARPILLDFLGTDPSQDYPMYRPDADTADGLATEVFVPALHGGKGAYVWAKATPLFDRRGEVAGAVQSVRDITAMRRAELTTRVLYLVSTASSAAMPDADLFASVFDILRGHLQTRLLFVSRRIASGEALTYPFFANEEHACPDLHKRLTALAETMRNAEEAQIRPESSACAPGTTDLWFSAPLRFGGRTLGAVIAVVPETPLRFTLEDAAVLSTVADHLASGINRSATESALRASEEKHRSIFENATEGIFQISLDHDLMSANPAMARIFGHDDVDGLMEHARGFLKDVAPSQQRLHLLEQVLAAGSVHQYELHATRPDGSTTCLSVNMRTVRDATKAIQYLEGSLTDITLRKEAERKLAIQTSLFQQLFDNSPQGILLLGKDGVPADLNPAFTTLFGYTRNDLHSLLELLLPPDSLAESFAFIASVLGGAPISVETKRISKDGRSIPVSMLGYPYVQDGITSGAFFIFNDISERKNYEEQLTRQALRDSLTGLPNRVLFMDRLTRAMERQKRRQDYRFAVLMIDLDGFKRVNDTQGHQAGDALLQEVSRRLAGCLRSVDTVARMGGDEFAVLLEDFQSNQEAIAITRRILSSSREPMKIFGREVLVSASVGVVLQTRRYSSPNDLLRDADICMYRSKELGKNQFKVFSKSMFDQVVQAVQLESDLRRALAADEFELYLQPIYETTERCLSGFEGLLRWHHPERGTIAPGTFMDVAEETGLVTEIGRWVLRRGFRIISDWQQRFPQTDISLALNLSPKDLIQPNLIGMLTDLLRDEGIDSSRIKLEITETAVMNNPELATSKLERLQKLGFLIAMDDFGTGYSSLSYLQRLPIDILKIDRSFVQTMQENPSNLEIIRAIVGLGKILDLHIVAEGVETLEQFQILKDLGCDLAQGYLLGRPMPLAQAETLLTV